MQSNRSLFITGIVFFTILGLSVISCNKKTVNLNEQTPEGQFEAAKRVFDKKDYFKAKTQFNMIVMANPGHRIIEQAQFYLAESYFYSKEYIQAIAEYEKLIRSMPQSPFVDDARYKVGLCYYELSPGYALDQEYTNKAITQFNIFLEEYPHSEMRPEVEKKLKEAKNKLAKKEYKTGELYRKMGYYTSAIISYKSVLTDYYDSDFIDDAMYWKGECHLKLQEWTEAIQTFEALLDRYPSSPWYDSARDKMRNAKEKLTKTVTTQESQE